jgi:hypothetical protein
MRILFVMRHGGYVRNFEWILRELADRGHHVHLGFERARAKGMEERIERGRGGFDLPDKLQEDTGGAVDHGLVPTRADRGRGLAFGLRQSVSYLRYLSPAYRDAEKLRTRWAKGTPRIVVALGGVSWLRSPLERLLRRLERRVPRSEEIEDHLRSSGYDAVLVTPLVDGPSQHDWLRSAKALGIPAALAVASWDNLTNKGVMFDAPDRIYVWNEIQQGEAVELHGLEPDTVAALGAHTFDHWFDWEPSRTREELCLEAGLDPRRPFLLYVCSSGFIAPDERPIVAAWVEALRVDPELADLGVLVRPHPTNGAIWAEHPLGQFANVAVWPRVGEDPTDESRRSGFYDSIHHSAAVVGANTTALIDAAIVGRRTYSVLLPELKGAQEQTLHFHYLLPENGGALIVARSLDEHLGQLRALLAGEAGADDWREPFLRTFVRPLGLERPVAPLVVDDLERFVGLVREPVTA